MSKIRHQDLIYEHNCVTVPLFFTPRAKAAQVRMQLAKPVNIMNTKNITRCGTVHSLDESFPEVELISWSEKKAH